MIKNLIIILSLIFPVNILSASDVAADISFLDLPLSARASSLGNTFLSDLGASSNLLLNPSNIWFGDRVNSNRVFSKNIFFRGSSTNYKIIGNNYYNIMGSLQFGNGITIGGGCVGISQSDINYYDSNANYLGEIKHTQNAYVLGSATRILGVNIGISGTYIQTDFSSIGEYGNQNDIIVSSIGLSINNKPINIKKETIFEEILIPSKISWHFLSRNIVSDISSEISISNSSLYKNIMGFRFDNNISKLSTYFLFDYKSNNSFTAEQVDIGWGVGNLFMSESFGDLSFNIGLRNFSFNQLSWGINYDISNINIFGSNWFDLIVGYSSFGNAWGGQTSVLSIKYFYDKN